MGEFESYIKSLCLISIFTGVISSAVPSGKLKNAFTGLCSVMLVFSMVLPLKGGGNFFENADSFSFSDSGKVLSSDVKTAEVIIYQQVMAEALEKEFLSSFNAESDVSACCENVNGEVRVISFEIYAALNEEQKAEIYVYLQERFPEAVITIMEAEDE